MTKKHYKLLAHQFRLSRFNARLAAHGLPCGQDDAILEANEAYCESFLDEWPCLRPQLDWRYDFGDLGDKLADRWEDYQMAQLIIYPHPTRTRLTRLARLDLDECDPTGQDEELNQLGGIGEIDEPTTLANMQ